MSCAHSSEDGGSISTIVPESQIPRASHSARIELCLGCGWDTGLNRLQLCKPLLHYYYLLQAGPNQQGTKVQFQLT